MVSLYKNMFKSDPKVQACHAGLECGILNERYPGLDMISFGPTIKNPHSPDEKVHIKSVEKFWNLLTEVLRNIPLKINNPIDFSLNYSHLLQTLIS